MPERLECEVLQKARYINTLTFTFTFTRLAVEPNHLVLSQRTRAVHTVPQHRVMSSRIIRVAQNVPLYSVRLQ